MTSPPLDSTDGQQYRAWHDITAFGQHTRSDYVGRGMTSPPLDSTFGRMTCGVACHHCGWAAHTIERCRAWHDITSLGMHAWSDDVGRGMKSPPLDSTHGRTTSVMAFHDRLWAAHTVKRRWLWHDITAFGKHRRSNDDGHDMPSPPLHCTHGRTMSGVTCHHRS